MSVQSFPEGFLWGTATASYQVEGSTRADGRGESIWDRFAADGHVWNGESGEPACDHYRRWPEDVALMRELGIPAYRFSIAWPRVFPAGSGRPNPAGLAFYDRLVDGLLAAGIEPTATLYHWDLPQALQEKGGWADRATAWRFQEYVSHVFERLGDRVKLWITQNEPWVAAFLGHARGEHAPGLHDLPTAVRVSHHLLLSHGLAVQAFRQMGMTGRIGITLNLHAYAPASGAAEDLEAMERVRTLDGRWFLDPLFRGSYPAGALAWYRDRGAQPAVEPDDMDLIAQPGDFLGINYYTRHVVALDPNDPLTGTRVLPPQGPATEMGWEVHPQGLRQVLRWVHAEYLQPRQAAQAGLSRSPSAHAGEPGVSGGASDRFEKHRSPWNNPLPLIITENGAAYPDRLVEDAEGLRVHDPERIAYLEGHLREARQAIEEGVPLAGYFAWSFMDNFEWALGYSRRFGLVYVDYATQRRIPKKSALWYREVIARNGLPG
ncbi:glycoside hydrolase family 1 protein [Limnochorda pilosa]|uniref:beta-glucosidase n=1 Tax=Limnochorda pilosa TaxID=1555112 RepID=A0A0K2SFS2_LIMPI|nr:beta-glucosidase [Limnochorda pilosa]BAS25882.1 beta-glucosidase [Limnochorda pilosa]